MLISSMMRSRVARIFSWKRSSVALCSGSSLHFRGFRISKSRCSVDAAKRTLKAAHPVGAATRT